MPSPASARRWAMTRPLGKRQRLVERSGHGINTSLPKLDTVARQMKIDQRTEPFADDLLRGMEAIAAHIGETERRAYYLAERGLIPCGKLGASWPNCAPPPQSTKRSRRRPTNGRRAASRPSASRATTATRITEIGLF